MIRALKAKNLKHILKTFRMIFDIILWREVTDERVFGISSRFLDIILNISGRMKTLGMSNIRPIGKTIFVSNHLGVFDPIYIITAVLRSTNGQRRCASLMRDDFFKSSFLNRRMERYIKTPLFPRSSIKKGGFQRVIQKVHENLDSGIIIFTCGTRSRNGEVLYLYPGEKGSRGRGPSARKDPGRLIKIILRNFDGRVELVPTTITYNYMDKGIGIVFGRPIIFDSEKDDRNTLNQKVEETINSIENQVYIGFHQLIPLLLKRYIFSDRKVGEGNGDLSIPQIKALLETAIDRLGERYHYTEENLLENFQQRFENTIEWYRSRNMLKIIDEHRIKICESRVCKIPELDTKFKKKNPFLFYLNQVKRLHILDEVMERVRPQLDHV